jgi:hypothetical protein
MFYQGFQTEEAHWLGLGQVLLPPPISGTRAGEMEGERGWGRASFYKHGCSHYNHVVEKLRSGV